MQQITKITKQEAKITAKLYIASLFRLQDSFSTDDGTSGSNAFSTFEIDEKIQNEIDAIILKLTKGLDELNPTTSYDCIKEAKRIVQNRGQ